MKERYDSGIGCSKVWGQKDINGEEWSCQPSIVTDYTVQSERPGFTVSELLYEFPQISLTVLYEIVTFKEGCHKSNAWWVPKILTGVHKTIKISLNFSVTLYE
jgi:hypothetical protein